VLIIRDKNRRPHDQLLALIAVFLIAIGAAVTVGTLLHQLWVQFRLHRALREAFAQRRMSNEDLSAFLTRLEDEDGIKECLLQL
jgi:hypothetical protein